ncbi:MAG: DUF3179 domain-containing protein [gamma proteobacterium symbiont of Lucinoma myriamae]|nr:DUF3179 domain-containing protein [gamma proteobacterium symbiont of Lucinoma myriamae]MCU7819415.1 DUF3179 domain-containing protein [gamma proteobacterium symbiont of Lucinoma myriamae]MCU7832000.1 DUF3179 domain-containing protein [gamma proteobacterium symbiont of Lucinoma myriamae]
MKKTTLGRLIVYPVILIVISIVFKDQLVSTLTQYNGFDLSGSLIDSNEIHHGGPAKDGIPAIDKPVFITAEQADYLLNDDHVLGLSINGISRAYPIKILNYHEIVNDFFLKKAVVMTYCPLCGSGVAYSANIEGTNTTFGVSGLLYNSDVLLYDRETNSLWSQLLSKAISGERKGVELAMLPVNHTTWQDWKKHYPDTVVLSDKTGFDRDYSRTPYGNYDKSQSLYFPVSQLNKDYHPKEYVLGLKLSGKTKVYPFAELSKMTSPYKDSLAGKEITITFDAKNRTGKILDINQNEIPVVTSFWFAWMAFYPASEVFKASD